MNETGSSFPTEEKKHHHKTRHHKTHHKRQQELHQSHRNSVSDSIILEKILDKISLQNEELQLLSEILKTNAIYIPKNNDRFDFWGG